LERKEEKKHIDLPVVGLVCKFNNVVVQALLSKPLYLTMSFACPPCL